MDTQRIATAAVRVIAALGVLVWASVVIGKIGDGWPAGSWAVLGIAVVLAGAHALIGLTVPARRAQSIGLTIFILVSDTLLGVLVDPKAFVLAAASVVLLVAVMAASPRT